MAQSDSLWLCVFKEKENRLGIEREEVKRRMREGTGVTGAETANVGEGF